ncbi:MAG TPA: polysaccharide biosynthesis/export family protein [Terriglobales bacterium]
MHKHLFIMLLCCLSMFAADTPVLTSRDRPYRIQPSDRLELQYRYTPEYNQSIEVQPDGMASINLVGAVKIGGLTVDQAKATILARLQTRLNDPEITLSLQEFVRPAYVVGGEVTNPGRYELHGETTVVEAIAMAGGFKPGYAKHSQVILYRRIDSDTAQTKLLNIKKLTDPDHPHLEESLALQPGDLLLIPQNKVSKIAPFVHWVSLGAYVPLR